MLVSQFRAIKLGLTSALWNMTGSKGSVLLGRWQQRHTRRVGVYGKSSWRGKCLRNTFIVSEDK